MSVVSLTDDREDRHNEQGLTRFGTSLDGSAAYQKNLAHGDRPVRWNEGLGSRRLDRDLFDQLEKACKLCSGLDRYYLPLAIYLATRTGLSLEEMCEVSWQDICLEKRRIEVPKCRMDRWEGGGRSVVLPFMAAWYLTRVALSLQDDNRFYSTGRLFPMTAHDLEKAWTFVAEQAGIGNLSFEDLRREASVTFGEAGLTKLQHDIMLGLPGSRVLPSPYSDLESMQDKLDGLVLGGLTYEEAKEDIPLVPPEEIISCRKWLASEGLLEVEESAPEVIPHFPTIVLTKL